MADEFTKAALYGIKTFNKKVKEKIGMERLVMLLDIYEEEVVGVHSVGEHITEKDEAWIISKKFGFIKWLVDNDKIDIEKVIDTAKSSVIDTYYYEEGIDDIYIPLLMVLAVEDEPIEYLLSVIK